MLPPMTTLSGQDLRSRDPRLPLHRRLADALTEAIRRGDYSPSDPLPSESEIARTCDVAIGTVRQAMAQLREDGLIERRQGRGTFVRRADFSHSLLRFFRFGDGGEDVPESSILTSTTVAASEPTSRALGLDDASSVLHLHRVRRLGGRPVVHEDVYLPLPEHEPLVDLEPGEYPNLLYPLYEERCGVVVVRASEELTLSSATQRDADVLGCSVGDPVVAIERVTTAVDGRVVEHRLSRGDARTFRYRVEIS